MMCFFRESPRGRTPTEKNHQADFPSDRLLRMGLENMILSPAIRRRYRISVFLAARIAVVPGKAQSGTADLTIADRVVVASRIYSLVQLYFAHWDGAPRNQVEEAYRRYADQLTRASSRREFDLAT